MNVAWYVVIGLLFLCGWQRIELGKVKLDLQVCQSDKKLAEEHSQSVRKQQVLVTEKIVDHYHTVTVTQKVKDDVIQTQADSVPVLKLSRGFVRVHDAAANGEPAETAARVDDTADSAVDTRTAAKTIATNYAACRQDQSRLSALQQWVAEQVAIEPPKVPDG